LRYSFGEHDTRAVNVREQQDALEFFNAIVDIVDESLKAVAVEPVGQRTFGGMFADQKICKTCPHRLGIVMYANIC
jgi:ubiquitin carboxyl-terminal hydrolase 9/24